MKTMKFFAIFVVMVIATIATSCTHHTARVEAHEWEIDVCVQEFGPVQHTGQVVPSGARILSEQKLYAGEDLVRVGSHPETIHDKKIVGYDTETVPTTNREEKISYVWGFRTCSSCGVKHLSNTECPCGRHDLKTPFTPSDTKCSDRGPGEGHVCDYCGSFVPSNKNKCITCGNPVTNEDVPYSKEFGLKELEINGKVYKDLGNGRFEVTEYVTKTVNNTVNKPIYEDNTRTIEVDDYRTQDKYITMYTYEVDEWHTTRTIKTNGTGLETYEGVVQLNPGERRGHTIEEYTIVYRVDDGTTITRTYKHDEWLRLKDGRKVKADKSWFLCFFYIVHQDSEAE